MAAIYAEFVVIERFCTIVILQATNSDESVLMGAYFLFFGSM